MRKRSELSINRAQLIIATAISSKCKWQMYLFDISNGNSASAVPTIISLNCSAGVTGVCSPFLRFLKYENRMIV